MTQRITMTALQLGEDSRMTKQALFGGAMGLALLFGLSACTDPYDPGQRAIGGGLLGAATGAAIGGGAATTPQRPPPPGYYPPPPGYYGGYPPPYPGY
jgi:hypothetical protein